MKIVVDTHSTNAEYNGDCDCAVVEITPELMAVIQRRVAIARQAVEQDRDLIELYFWDAAAAYYDQGVVENCQEVLWGDTDEAQKAASDWLTKLEQEEGYARLPDGVELARQEAQRTDCDQMIIQVNMRQKGPEFGIAWTTIPKHTEIYVTTSEVPLAALEAFLHETSGLSRK